MYRSQELFETLKIESEITPRTKRNTLVHRGLIGL